MKKLLALSLVVAALGVTSSAFAQAAGPKGLAPASEGKGKRLDRKEMERINEEILDKLNLTEDQKAKLKAHKEETAAKLKEARKGAKGGDKEAAKEKAKAIRKENANFMKTLLTKEQMREMQKLRREAVKEAQAKKDGSPKA
jgi:periplasmic protein CpxP/Spy